MNPDPVTITVDATHTVSGLLSHPDQPVACLVLAHGAGAGMTHTFMTAVADGLATHQIASLRFQFPYMEAGSKRPDRPALAHATIRAAVATTAQCLPNLPLFAGGKSFGGRMTSQTQAEAPLPGVRGLAFLGFPLHPAGKPSDDRAEHLTDIRIPLFFAQGTRDTLADIGLLVPLIDTIGATSTIIDHADHSFHVPARSGRTDAQVLATVLDELTVWMRGIAALRT